MTRNQILYQEYRERNRSNKANESLTAQRDRETARSNLAREAETHRSNVANETETNRSNLAREFETNRANLARENETYRSNIARENELYRSNVANEAERNRSNLANELQRTKELAETTRSNQAKESLTAREIAETARTHRANESLRAGELAETSRSNLARELEINRHNQATEEAATRGQDLIFINEQRGQDLSRQNAQEANQNRIDVASINAASQQAIQELREQGMNERQAKEIVAGAVKVVHDDVVGLLNNQDAVREIRRTILDTVWQLQNRR